MFIRVFKLFLGLVFVPAFVFAQNPAEDILKKVVSNNKRYDCGKYYIVHKFKGDNHEDTIFYKATCYFNKEPALKFKINWEYAYNKLSQVVNIYNANKIYHINHQKKTVSIDKSFFHWSIDYIVGTPHSQILHEPLLRPSLFFSKLPKQKILKGQIIWDNQPYFLIKCIQETKHDKEEIYLYVNQKNYHIDKIARTYAYEGMAHYREYVVSQQTFNQEDFRDIYHIKDLEETYDIQNLKLERYRFPKLLKKGTEAPDWHLKNLDGTTIALSDLRGKVVLLDFWYTSCRPCLQALPSLQRLHEKYKARPVVIVGINSRDKAEGYLKEFLEKKNITYMQLVEAKEVEKELYHVSGNPTVYIIDQSGKVAFTKEGHYASNEKQFSKVIEKLLKEHP